MTGQQQTIIDCTPADGWDGIAAALARARPGERVRCAAGDYRGTTSLRVPGGVTLAGVPGTHLIWAGEGSAVRVDGVAGVVIEGIEVLGGEGPRAQTVPEESLDAPILVVDCTRVKIADCAVSGGGEYLHGILIRLCSGVAIEDCRALDCRNGILIESSIDTTADRNLCGNNRRAGIGATRDSEHPERPCHCRFTGNRCHHNQRHGIAFHSSQGLARDNECWANARSGISLERDSITPNAPANADLIGNQCHHNQQTGITFLSSQGIARDNDCWANARSGISLERNSDARDGPDAPANPELIGNRCHHNLEAGILFTSSQGRAENNDCWGSHTRSGIVIQRGTDTRNVPANAELIDNRCHDNQQGGIDFLSSDGSTEGNHCWGNRVSDPIRQQREWRDQKRYYLGELPACSVQVGSHFTSPPAPATRRNRPLVEALTEFGIDRPEPLADFLRSGCLDCFGRFWSGDSAARTTDPERAAPTVQETGPIDPNAPRVYFYSQDPQGRVKLERKRHYGKPKAAKPPQPPLSATLAGFVETWLKAVTHNEWDKVHPPTHPANDRTPATAPQNRADPRQKQPAPHQHPGLAWNLALVSARPTSLDHWLHGLEADREQHLHSITRRWADAHIAPDRPPRLADPLVVDLTGWSGGKDGLRQKAEQEILVDRGRRIEQSRGDQAKSAGGAAALLDEGTRLEALGRRHERRRELWLLPMGWKLILLLLPALLLLVAGLALLGIPTAGKLLTGFLHQGPGAWPTLTHQLAHALWDAFGKLKLGYQVVWVLMPVAALTTWLDAFNLPLPRRLHVHPRGIRGVALALVKKVVADPTDILVDQKHIARLMTRLDEAASRRWLRHRLFGHLGRRSDLALLVLRGLDRLPRQDEAPRAKQDKAVQPRQEDADWLRELPWLARQREGLLLVTQMGDLSHLVGAWFPQLHPPKPGSRSTEPAAAQPSPAPIWDRALLVHEPGAARIQPVAPDVGAVNRVAQETALNALAQTLGCEQDDHRRTTCVSTLADRLWVPLDLLPALVLGSTPAVSMTLSKKQSDSPKQYGPDWERETRPYRALFQGPDADGGPDDQEVKQLFEYGVRATGIMAVKIGEGPPYWVRLIGHAGKRVRLAETLRACVVPGAATEGYLTRLLACGESYNLRRVLESITGQADPLGHADSGSGAAGDRLPSPERRADGAQLPLHLEAALYLVRERLALTPGDGALAETMGETLDSAWLALARALDAPLPPPGPPPAGLWPDTATRRADAARCYCAYLGAVELLESAPVASADRPRQASLLADPGFMERLAKTLEDGEADRQQVQEQVGAMCQLELEGIAFGTLLPATQIIDALKAELEEVRVQAAGAPE